MDVEYLPLPPEIVEIFYEGKLYRNVLYFKRKEKNTCRDTSNEKGKTGTS